MAIGSIEQNGTGLNKPRKATPLDDQINRAHMIHDRLLKLSSSLQTTADRLLGEEPEACAKDGGDPANYSGAMYRLRDVLEDITATVDRLESKANRLSDAI